ncbi:MAG: ferrous iron transporter B [Candidatus Obscuribacterales bacterium]|nr:ferrous iron transporter B [Candidatus Obscuribacterales bacterium]
MFAIEPSAQAPVKNEKGRKLVLAGNPNVGKSALFNALTGMNADVSNYPGTTIDVSYGRLVNDRLVDTPGAYGVSAFNDEERIARDLILAADGVINVVSALSLERDLFLTLQLIDMGMPLLLVVNQWDEALAQGIKIDLEQLSTLLGVPALSAVAVKGEGVAEIKEKVSCCRAGLDNRQINEMISGIISSGVPRSYALLIAEGDQELATKYGVTSKDNCLDIYQLRRQLVNDLVQKVVIQAANKKRLSARIGRLLLHPLYGGIISLAVCYLIFYQLLGVFVAGKVVDITEKQLMKVHYEPNLRRVIATIFPSTIAVNGARFDFPEGTLSAPLETKRFEEARVQANPEEVEYDFWSHPSFKAVIGNSLAGEYGILTLTVTYLFGLLFPLVLAFYFGLSLLEDSGYLPRLAVLVDRLLNKIGLTGRAIIPLILGLGCVTMATVTTRLLSSPREKIIATALLGIAIPCSAQLGIVSGTLAKLGGALPWAIYGAIVFGMLAFTGFLLNKILPGKSGALMIDLPPMRLPRAGNVLNKTWTKSWNFMLESIPMFCIAGIVVTVGQMTGALDWFIKLLQPLSVGWLGLPNDPRIPTTFILGIVRRDFAAFGLTDVALSAAQAVVAMVVITLFVPCIATVGVMIKERGFKIAMIIWLGSWLFAFLIGGLLAQLLPGFFKFCGY